MVNRPDSSSHLRSRLPAVQAVAVADAVVVALRLRQPRRVALGVPEVVRLLRLSSKKSGDLSLIICHLWKRLPFHKWQMIDGKSP